MDDNYWQLYKELRENGLRPEDAIIKIHELKLTSNEIWNKIWEKKMQIKIVGSIGDHDEVDTIKKITEVFIIESRIKSLMLTDE